MTPRRTDSSCHSSGTFALSHVSAVSMQGVLRPERCATQSSSSVETADGNTAQSGAAKSDLSSVGLRPKALDRFWEFVRPVGKL